MRTQRKPTRSISFRVNVRRDLTGKWRSLLFARPPPSCRWRMSHSLHSYGETSRIVGFFTESTDTVAGRIFDLHRRHASAVCRVFDRRYQRVQRPFAQGSLPSDCLLSLVVGQRAGESAYPAAKRGSRKGSLRSVRSIRMAIDEDGRRVVFDRWGEVRGVSAELLIALAKPFRQAVRDELAPERYPFTPTVAAHAQNQL